MGTLRKILVWILPLMLLVVGCTGKPAQTNPNEPVPTAKLVGSGVQFDLTGYKEAELPSLRVTSVDGKDWSTLVGKPVREGDTVTAVLSGERGTAKLAVEQFDYVWTLSGGKTVGGTVQFRDVRFREMAWQVTRTEHLLIYHVNSLEQGDPAAWEKALGDVLKWTGMTRETPMVLWVFPSLQTLNEWARYGADHTVAGLWLADIDRLIIHDGSDPADRLTIMAHEMVHAVSPGEGPAWFEEGIAQLLESRHERAKAGAKAPRWKGRKALLEQLRAAAQTGTIQPTETNRSHSVLDPYTLGVSVWLFVKHHHGEEGVRRFLRDGGKENGVKTVLEDLFHKDLPAIWVDWNTYLRGPDLLKDWEQP